MSQSTELIWEMWRQRRRWRLDFQ